MLKICFQRRLESIVFRDCNSNCVWRCLRRRQWLHLWSNGRVSRGVQFAYLGVQGREKVGLSHGHGREESIGGRTVSVGGAVAAQKG